MDWHEMITFASAIYNHSSTSEKNGLVFLRDYFLSHKQQSRRPVERDLCQETRLSYTKDQSMPSDMENQ